MKKIRIKLEDVFGNKPVGETISTEQTTNLNTFQPKGCKYKFLWN